MKKKIFTIIEITDTHIKFLQFKRIAKNDVMSACVIQPIKTTSDDDIAKQISQFKRTHAIEQEHLTLIIPRRYLILKLMSLPSESEAEIKKMIGLQLVSQIPYALTDITYDYQILSQHNTGYTQVLVTVVHNDISSRYLKIFQKAQLPLSKMTSSSLGLCEWLTDYQHKQRQDSKDAVMLINIDLLHTEICFCQNNELLFSRSINIGAQKVNPESIGQLVKQVQTSLNSYRNENMGPQVMKALVISTLGDTSFVQQELQKGLDLKVTVVDAIGHILAEKDVDLSALKNNEGITITALIGLRVNESKALINLIPEEVHVTKQTQTKRKQGAQFIALFILAIVVCMSILGVRLYQKSQQLKTIEDQLEKLGPAIKQAQVRTDFVNFFTNELRNRNYISDLILELQNLTPDEISYRSLTLNDSSRFIINGYAETSSSVNMIQNNLVKSPLFKQVSLEFATKRKIFKTSVTDFKFITELRSEEGEL